MESIVFSTLRLAFLELFPQILSMATVIKLTVLTLMHVPKSGRILQLKFPIFLVMKLSAHRFNVSATRNWACLEETCGIVGASWIFHIYCRQLVDNCRFACPLTLTKGGWNKLRFTGHPNHALIWDGCCLTTVWAPRQLLQK